MPLINPTRDSITEDLQRLGQWRQALGESLRHQKAAQHEVAFLDWMAEADNAIHRYTMLDALKDPETWAHLQRTLAGEIREAVEDAKDETIRQFFETLRAGER